MALRDRVLEEESIAIIDRRWRDGPLRIEPANRRIRVFFADKAIADSFRALLQMEDRHLPVYYFPREDVRMDLTEPSNTRTTSPHKGEATYRSIRVGDRTSNDAMWIYEDPVAGAEALAAHVAFYWDKVDAWYEEDDEVFVHPRDPYHRVDVLHSSRHVRIQVGGETIAETTRARLLFETGLPTRYYIPKLDVRMERLRPSAKHTRCPTRAWPHTGTSPPGTGCLATWSGATPSRSPSARRSRTSSVSSTSTPTSTSTASSNRSPSRPGRRRSPVGGATRKWLASAAGAS